MATTPAVEQFLHAIESATIPECDVWSADATLDATVPNWRLHAAGPAAIRAEYARWFADPGHFDELHHYPVGGAADAAGAAGGRDGAADGGASDLIEYTLSWSENGVPHAAHHMHLLTVRDGRIVADTVMCGGRWPASLLAEMEAADG
jgi:hypothetical protein